MFKVNENFLSLRGGYLFSEIGRRVAEFSKANPQMTLYKMGIGDVTRPLVPAVVEAMKKASDEMGKKETFRGYGPDFGYDFLRKAIAENDYHSRGVNIQYDEIFMSDGAKCDTGNIGDILSTDNIVALGDPVYPVYVDTNVMSGRAGAPTDDGRYSKLIYLDCTAENGFCAPPPNAHADIIYLCYPNNPTGVMATRAQLAEWVDYALSEHSLLLYDAAYEAFITEDLPHSIYEIDGAEKCAIEFRSFSKTAGFTGTRCGFAVIPRALTVTASDGSSVSLHSLWSRRVGTKFNGVSYVTQRAAEAIYSPEGKIQVRDNINYYLNNAKIVRDGLTAAGYTCYGGVNSPYIWMQTPNNAKSWDFFDYLLNTYGIVTTPGEGFGRCGEGYIRLSALGDAEVAKKAISLITSK